MCQYTIQSVAKIAENDISVYKMVTKINTKNELGKELIKSGAVLGEKLYSPYTYAYNGVAYVYDVNNVMTESRFHRKLPDSHKFNDGSDMYIIDYGFHSFKSMRDAKFEMLKYNQNYIVGSYFIALIYKAIIPKHSEYYEGTWEHTDVKTYVSNNLKLVREFQFTNANT